MAANPPDASTPATRQNSRLCATTTAADEENQPTKQIGRIWRGGSSCVLCVKGWLSRGTGPDWCGGRTWQDAAAPAVSGRRAAWLGVSRWSAGGRAVHQFSGGHRDGCDHGDRGRCADAPGQGMRAAHRGQVDGGQAGRERRAAQVTAVGPPCDEEPPSQAEWGDRRRLGTRECRSWALRYLLVPAGQYTVAVPSC